MKLVVDANVLFSALLKDSITRKLISDRRLELFAPKFLLVEFLKYSKELQEKSKLSQENFFAISQQIISRIDFVADEQILIFFEAAKKLITDKKDAPYVACSLALNADLWSNDKQIINPRIKVWNTKQVYDKLYA